MAALAYEEWRKGADATDAAEDELAAKAQRHALVAELAAEAHAIVQLVAAEMLSLIHI